MHMPALLILVIVIHFSFLDGRGTSNGNLSPNFANWKKNQKSLVARLNAKVYRSLANNQFGLGFRAGLGYSSKGNNDQIESHVILNPRTRTSTRANRFTKLFRNANSSKSQSQASATEELQQLHSSNTGLPPSKCCLPAIYQYRSELRMEEDSNFERWSISRAFDRLRMKIAENVTIFKEDSVTPEKSDYIIDGIKHKIYYIDREKDCARDEYYTEEDWSECVPTIAEYTGTETVGAGATRFGIDANVFAWTTVSLSNTGLVRAALTDEDCTPVSITFDGFENGDKTHLSQEVYDFKNQLQNADTVFKIPGPCEGPEFQDFERKR